MVTNPFNASFYGGSYHHKWLVINYTGLVINYFSIEKHAFSMGKVQLATFDYQVPH